MTQPLELTMDECVRLKNKLDRAEEEGNTSDLRALLTEVKGGKPNDLKHLKNSGISIKIKHLSKHGDSGIAQTALAVMNAWKALCGTKDKPKTPAQPTIKAEVKAEVKAEAPPVQEEAPPVKAEVPPATEVPPPLKHEASSGGASSSIKRPIQRTLDAVRDSVREKLQEAFDKGVEANVQFLREQVTDTAMMAEMTETCMFNTYGGTSKDYKARFRSLLFNLRDPKNPEFIKQVVTGQLFTEDLATMEVKNMASAEVKKQREKWQENAKMALMDERSYRNYKGTGIEDGILKCPKCKSMKTEYIEVQTRSADEPTTKKCLCNNCDYRWKFC